MDEIAIEERPDHERGFESTWMIDRNGNGQDRRLGEAASAEAIQVWREAYDPLDGVFIEKERQIYRQQDGELRQSLQEGVTGE